MSILNPTPQEIDEDKIRTYREYWNPPPTAITSPTIESLHNDLNSLTKKEAEGLKPEHFKQRTFVVAGTHAEYNDWIERKGYSRTEYVYVASINNIRGISAEDLKGVYIGTWRNRSDINEIKNQIAAIKYLITGSSDTSIYYDGAPYIISTGGAGGGGFISSGGAGYDVTTTTISTAEIIREKLHDEIVKLGYGDATRVYPILAAIDSVLDEYCSGILKGENYAELVL
jgi:hypothetical protein